MSITFYSDASIPAVETREPCLCSQMAPCWCDAMGQVDAFVEELGRHANPGCPFCEGTGVEVHVQRSHEGPNWANGNAALLCSAMGVSSESGALPLGDFQRAILRAANRSPEGYTREESIEYGKPREIGGVIELKPVRVFSKGLSVERERELSGRGSHDAFWRQRPHRGAAEDSRGTPVGPRMVLHEGLTWLLNYLLAGPR